MGYPKFRYLLVLMVVIGNLFAQVDSILALRVANFLVKPIDSANRNPADTSIDSMTIITLDSFKLATDDTMELRVQARTINNPTTWLDVSGSWSLPQNDLTVLADPLPIDAHRWSINPKKPFKGTLTVKVGNRQTSVQVISRASPPSKIFLSLTNHPDSILAGQPIRIAARVENTDGPVPGAWTGTGVVADTNNQNNTISQRPWLKVNNRAIADSLGQKVSESFVDGLDTIDMYLYKEGMHKIDLTCIKQGLIKTGLYKMAVLDSLLDSTQAFKVHPALTPINPFTVSPPQQFKIRITTGSMTLDCLQPFSGQVFSLEGRTVARFTNVTSYNLKSQQMPTGKYILRASTGIGNPMQRIITLFQ